MDGSLCLEEREKQSNDKLKLMASLSELSVDSWHLDEGFVLPLAPNYDSTVIWPAAFFLSSSSGKLSPHSLLFLVNSGGTQRDIAPMWPICSEVAHVPSQMACISRLCWANIEARVAFLSCVTSESVPVYFKRKASALLHLIYTQCV